MPEYYPSIGDAVGAAMAHNIRLAHGNQASDSDAPLQVRSLPRPSADPYSVPGMIARLTETATPHEVAGIIEEVTGALVGAFPQLTELVAAAADWARVRLDFDDPHRHNLPFEAWKRLAAAHTLLRDAEEQLKVAEDLVTDCPTGLTDPRHHEMVNVLRTRELLHDVLGAAVAADSSAPRAGEQRQRAATAASPNAASVSPPPAPAVAYAPASDATPAPRRTR